MYGVVSAELETGITVAVFRTSHPDSENGREQFHVTAGNFPADLHHIMKRLDHLREGNELHEIAVAVPGRATWDRLDVTHPTPLDWWVGQEIGEALSPAFQARVVVGSHAEAAGMTYGHYDAVGSNEDFWVLRWEPSGVSACLARRLGRHSITVHPSDIGHMPVGSSNISCPCGQSGCVNRHIALSAEATSQLTPAQWKICVDMVSEVLVKALYAQPTPRVVVCGSVMRTYPWLGESLARQLSDTLRFNASPLVVPFDITYDDTSNALSLLKIPT